MVLVSYSGKEINAKLVYYGPGLSGKTTNLEFIYSSIPQTHRGKMVSMKTKTERTLFFDFLPVNLGELAGFKTRFLLYTVPGQVYYNATRKLVLKGVDAVVFVADSKRGKMDENVESLENLKENLREHGLTLETMPWVIQYNKRDLPDVYSIDELEQVLNPNGAPHYEAVAMSGGGVVETFKAVSKLLLRKLSKEVGVPVNSTRRAESVAAATSAAEPTPAFMAPTMAAPPAPLAPPAPPLMPMGSGSIVSPLGPQHASPGNIASGRGIEIATGAASFGEAVRTDGGGTSAADSASAAPASPFVLETRHSTRIEPADRPASDPAAHGSTGSGFTLGSDAFEMGPARGASSAASADAVSQPASTSAAEAREVGLDNGSAPSVADRLRRWLGGRKDSTQDGFDHAQFTAEPSMSFDSVSSAPSVSSVSEKTQLEAPPVTPAPAPAPVPVPMLDLAPAVPVTPLTSPPVAPILISTPLPTPIPTPTPMATSTPAPAPTLQLPREIHVPVLLDPKDLERGFVLRLSVRVASGGQTSGDELPEIDTLKRAA